jgi:hypothetical protein
LGRARVETYGFIRSYEFIKKYFRNKSNLFKPQ